MSEWSVEASAEAGVLVPIPLTELEEVSRAVLAAEEGRDAEISIALVTDATISELNEQYLSHAGPTDVISFPLVDAIDAGRLVGDIYIGVEQARRQAAEMDVPFREELLRLAVHGTLHILGWDHPEGEESPMFTRQEELLQAFLGGS